MQFLLLMKKFEKKIRMEQYSQKVFAKLFSSTDQIASDYYLYFYRYKW